MYTAVDAEIIKAAKIQGLVVTDRAFSSKGEVVTSKILQHSCCIYKKHLNSKLSHNHKL